MQCSAGLIANDAKWALLTSAPAGRGYAVSYANGINDVESLSLRATGHKFVFFLNFIRRMASSSETLKG